MAGLAIPVQAKRRYVFTFSCRGPVENCPLLIDTSGAYVRPEGEGHFICGASPEADLDPDWSDEDPASQEIDHAFFEEFIWPSLAHRVPAFEAIRPGRAWSGPYDMCLLDHNAIVGTAGEIEKFLSLQRLLGPRAAAGPGRRTRPCRADRPWRIPDARPVRTRLRARARQQAAPRAQRDLARRGPSRAIRLYATRSSLAVSRSPRPGSSLLRGFFRSDTPPTRRRSGSFPVAGVKSFGGRGFHFEAGYDCHIFVIETSLGLNAWVMNDNNVPDGMTWERSR